MARDRKEPKGRRKGFKTKISSNGFERTVMVGRRRKKPMKKK